MGNLRTPYICMEKVNLFVILNRIDEFIRKSNEKVLQTWKIVGILVLGICILGGVVFCRNVIHVALLVLIIFLLASLWYYKFQLILRSMETTRDGIRMCMSIEKIRLYLKDLILSEAFKIRAENSDSRDKMSELNTMYESIETLENIVYTEEIMKRQGLSFNDGWREQISIWDKLLMNKDTSQLDKLKENGE